MTALKQRPRRKITLRLPESLHATTIQAVSLGLAPTQNAFIEQSIRMRTREVRHARMARLAEEAMNDPGFVSDMRDTMSAFRFVDAERWPANDDEG